MAFKHFRFIENPKHLFECFTPPTPEQIVWKQHPIFEHLWASNAGFVECRDGYNELIKGSVIDRRGDTYCYIAKAQENCDGRFIVHGGPRHPKRYPSWHRLVIEAFRGSQYKNRRLLRINHNPYDNRIDNLCYWNELSDPKAWYKSHCQFMQNTLHQLYLREKLLPEDWEYIDYFNNVLFVPYQYTREYEKYRKKFDI